MNRIIQVINGMGKEEGAEVGGEEVVIEVEEVIKAVGITHQAVLNIPSSRKLRNQHLVLLYFLQMISLLSKDDNK